MRFRRRGGCLSSWLLHSRRPRACLRRQQGTLALVFLPPATVEAMLQDWLRRFRVSGLPGPPATAGVPLDKQHSLEAELRPLLARLADAEQQTKAVEEQFDLTIRQLLDNARARAQQTSAAAHVLAASERERVIAERRAGAVRERENLLGGARA